MFTHHQPAHEANLGRVVKDPQIDHHLVDVRKRLGGADGFEQAKNADGGQLKFGNGGHPRQQVGQLTLDEACAGQQTGGLVRDRATVAPASWI